MTEENSSYTPGEEVKWVMRPSGGGGYLHGIVVKIGPRKIGIAVENQKTQEWYPKWVSALSLRKKVASLDIDGAVCIECNRWYSLVELEEIDQTGVVPCGHRWAGLFDTIPG